MAKDCMVVGGKLLLSISGLSIEQLSMSSEDDWLRLTVPTPDHYRSGQLVVPTLLTFIEQNP